MLLVALAAWTMAGEQASADAICNDGTYSEADGQGACSWHGGVDYWRRFGSEGELIRG
jgi:hypothetical protein